MAIGNVSAGGFVYVIGPAEPCEPYRVKIGWAGNATRRLRDLQGASPVRLEILHVIQADDPARLEGAIHDELAGYRRHREWFELGEDPVAMVKAAMAAVKAEGSRGRSETMARESDPWL